MSLNPQRMYQLGRADGEKDRKNSDIINGIEFAKEHLLLAMAYVNEKDDEMYLSKEQFREFYLEVEKTLDELINESINGEAGIDTYDITDLHFGHDREVREKYGLPENEFQIAKYEGKKK